MGWRTVALPNCPKNVSVPRHQGHSAVNTGRRAIAVLILLVFAPASMLAGPTWRICVGQDGHRAIEFVLEAEHHADASDEHNCLEAGEYHVDALAECFDSPLLSAAQTSLLMTAPQPNAAVLIALVGADTRPAWSSREDVPRVPRPESHVRERPQLKALRTIVLLI